MNRAATGPAVEIRQLTSSESFGVNRVSATVDGVRLWFESRDAALRPSPEAFATALLIPALESRSKLSLDVPLNRAWMDNVSAMSKILNQWWGYPVITLKGKGSAAPEAKGRKTALCFSGGVDSFYTLLRGGHKIDLLVFVHGYDILLGDWERMDALKSSLKAIAPKYGAESAVIRTNLRMHPSFSGVAWTRSHGGALAAIGHLLSDEVGRLLISSSYPYHYNRYWGSHWKIDPLWSSDSLDVEHIGASLWRSDKLRAIAHEPLVQNHLRVCWENLNSGRNCSRCEKCIRTMLVLAQVRCLDRYTVFDGARLAERIDEMPAVDPEPLSVYEETLRQGLEPELAAAVKSLIDRSRNLARISMRGVRKMIDRILPPFTKSPQEIKTHF